MITRRQAITSHAVRNRLVGLRALATGLPTSFLLNPRRALAANAMPALHRADKAQYIIFNTSGGGDPINANVPGTYEIPTSPTAPTRRWRATPLRCGADAHRGGALGARSAGGRSIARRSGT